ncbi:MAG: metallophosphoesterase [Phycisphaerales bacterium JB058]
MHRTLSAAISTFIASMASSQTISDARVGLLDVRQLDAGNSRTSVSVSVRAGSALFSTPESNKGDYDIAFGSGDDLSRGVAIVSPRNRLRTNTAGGNQGGNTSGDQYATVCINRPPTKVDLIATVHGAPTGPEINIDVAAAFFPIDAGFFAGHALNSTNNGPIDQLVATPGLELGDEFIDSPSTSGVYQLDLTNHGATGDNGVLIACGGKNEDNFALVRNLGSGHYEIVCKDNGDDNSGSENDPVAFVYLPYTTQGLTAGRIAQGSGITTVLSGTGGFTASTLATGQVLIQIAGVTSEEEGALLVCPEAPSMASDNIIVCEWLDAMQGYVVDSLDIPSMTPEDSAGAPMFSFAYVPVTEGDAIEPSPNASTIAVLPDTQYYARDYPAIFHDQLQWIADNAASRHIEMVLHLGDITNDNDDPQWSVARAAFDRIHLTTPFHLAQGNHDVGPSGNGSNRDTLMNDYFPAAYYAAQPTFGGALSNRNLENSYSLFKAGGRKWIALALEWGPRDQVLDWANQVLADHDDRLAIVITHAYMFDDDTRMDHLAGEYNGSPYSYGTEGLAGGTNDGGDIWRNLVSLHPNTALVMSGHITGEGRLSSETPFGNVVHQMLIDYQGRPNGGAGYLRLIELFAGSDLMRFRTYSPWEDGYYTGTGSHFELELITAPGHEGWVCSRADVNGDGLITPADFSTWVSRFNSNAPGCDQNQDGACSAADFSAWVASYNAGCG